MTHHLGHKFGNLIDFGERLIEHAPHVLDRRFRRQSTESNDLRNVVHAVFTDDVLDRALASVHAEVYIEVGVGHALGVEESLEVQVVF